MQSGVSPDEAIVLYDDLSRALSGVNLESDLHLLYLVIPQDRGLYPDFQVGGVECMCTCYSYCEGFGEGGIILSQCYCRVFQEIAAN